MKGAVVGCAALLALLLGVACNQAPVDTTATATSLPEPIPEPAPEPPPPPAPPPPARVVLLAGGDVCLARDIGQTLLADPNHDFFTPLAPLLAAADLRFANLEGPLSEQKGETQSPWNRLTFTGPPNGAEAVARAGFEIVSTANNHAWDYGLRGLTETLDNLDRAGVRHVGTGRDLAAAEAPVILEKNGLRLGFLAVTDIWNIGLLKNQRAAGFVAGADQDRLAASVRALRASGKVDIVVVSYHGGVEYLDYPIPKTRDILHAAVDAGADVVIGHHPHVLQGIEWYAGKPILLSLGNLLMRLGSAEHVPTGYLARLTLEREKPPTLSACPLAIRGAVTKRVVDEPDEKARALAEQRFSAHLTRISKGYGTGITVGAPGPDGCLPVVPREAPAAR